MNRLNQEINELKRQNKSLLADKLELLKLVKRCIKFLPDYQAREVKEALKYPGKIPIALLRRKR
jgi:hypothetical protein